MSRVIITITILCAILISTVTFGCGRAREESERVIATVNGAPLYVKDFKRDLALHFKRDPLFRVTPQTLDNQLNMMIDKRLLIQEAKKKRLDRTDRFVDTIKAFWEQTLIRDLMSDKDREFKESVSASESELRDYHDKLSYQIVINIVKNRNRPVVERLAKNSPDTVAWEEEIGPITIEDASSPVVLMAFRMEEGEMKVIPYGGFHYLIFVKKKERVGIQSFDQMKEKIEEAVKNYKKRELFNSWLSEIRKNTDIKVNNDTLKEIQYKYSRE